MIHCSCLQLSVFENCSVRRWISMELRLTDALISPEYDGYVLIYCLRTYKEPGVVQRITSVWYAMLPFEMLLSKSPWKLLELES